MIVAGDALVLFAIPENSAPRGAQTDLAPVAFLQQHLGQSRFFTLGPLQPNYGSYWGIGSLNINDVPVPSVFADYVHKHLDPVVDPTVFVGNYGGGRSLFEPSPMQELLKNLAAYRAAGVAYVLVPRGQALAQSPATFKLVSSSPSTQIYRLAGAAPYFSATSPACSVRSQNRETAQITCTRPATLIRRETALPGWSAHVDGHSVPVHMAGGLFQAVTVGPGSHRVTFSYLPPNVAAGFAAVLVGCGWLLLAPLARRWRGSHAKAESGIEPV